MDVQDTEAGVHCRIQGLAVKRVQGGEGIAKVAREPGLVEQTPCMSEGRQERQAQLARGHRHTRADGSLADTRRVHPPQDGERDPQSILNMDCRAYVFN